MRIVLTNLLSENLRKVEVWRAGEVVETFYQKLEIRSSASTESTRVEPVRNVQTERR